MGIGDWGLGIGDLGFGIGDFSSVRSGMFVATASNMDPVAPLGATEGLLAVQSACFHADFYLGLFTFDFAPDAF